MISIPRKPVVLGPHVGQSRSRVDGRKKVTGEARYAADHDVPDLLYGVIVNATVSTGTITSLDVSDALAVAGVVHVFTHENRPPLPYFDRSYKDMDTPAGKPFRPLYDAKILFDGQPIALVVADTIEAARLGARRIAVTYDTGAVETSLRASQGRARDPEKWTGGRKGPPKPRGDADGALAAAAFRVDAVYAMAAEHHNPMELFATTAVVEADGTYTLWDKTQGVMNVHSWICKVLGLEKEAVRVRTPFVGGAFGSGLRPQHQVFFATMAAKELQRSVRVELTRQQMFTFGHRPASLQRIALGATAEGKLTAIVHEATQETSRFEDYVETMVSWGPLLYTCENVRTSHQVVPLDVCTPLDMRAPGAASGLFAFESAIDELAFALQIDPLELRLRNYAERAVDEDKEFSSKELRACYARAAEAFGWSKRSAAVGSMRDGDHAVGWGMATGCWDAQQLFASARARLGIDGKLTVASATTDIGTGTYTIMTQIAADVLGLSMDAVTFELGDTELPLAPLQGGSWTAVTVGSAVKAACDEVGKQLHRLATKMEGSPLAGLALDAVAFEDGHVVSKDDGSKRVAFQTAMRAGEVLVLEGKETALPNPGRTKYAHYAHSAVFVEVKVDELLGVVRVTRVVTAVAAGRIFNPKTARSQILGAVVWGISMALHEEAMRDHRAGRIMNHTFAEYHVSVNADVGDVEVIFVDEKDEHVNALGAKGVGEIGILGVAAAVANAIHHATGKRVRELPITVDRVMA